MPSFDIVSEVDLHELANSVDQASRTLETRFDFKGSGAVFERNERTVTMRAPEEFQIDQMLDILRQALSKRGIDTAALALESREQTGGGQFSQSALLRHGIDSELCKKLVKLIKMQKLKVQAQIQGEQVRVSGKKRDDLQQIIELIKADDFDLPFQFINFRD